MSSKEEDLAKKLADKEEGVLVAAKAKAMKAMKDNPTAKNVASYKACDEALEEYLARKNPQAEGAKPFKGVQDVLEYLTTSGWKVSQSKLYADIDDGLLRRSPEGFQIKEVDRYASTHLEKLSSEDDDVSVSDRKATAQAGLAEVQLKREQMEFDRDRGLLIEVEKLNLALAGRAAVLKGDFRNYSNSAAPRIIELVGGDASKLPALIQFLQDSTDEYFNRYAEERSFVAEIVGK